MTKAELINEIAIQTGIDKNTITHVVEASMYCIKKTVAEGENIYLRGFGTFETKVRKARIARNICAQVSIQVPEHKVPHFKPSDDFTALL